MNRTLFRRTLPFVLGTTLAGTGCVGLQPVPDHTRYYTLTAPETGAPAAPATAGSRVGVRVLVSAEYLRRPSIAVRVGSHELRFASEQRWAERLDTGLERTLAAGLQARLPDATVTPLPGGSWRGAAALVEVRLAACEGTSDGGAVLEAYWRIATDDPARTAAGHFRERRDGWDGQDYGQLAAWLSELATQLAASIAAEAPPLLTPPAPP